MAVGVVEAGYQSHAVAVETLCCDACQWRDVVVGADGKDATVSDGDSVCQWLGGFLGQDSGVEQQKVGFGSHGLSPLTDSGADKPPVLAL